MEGSLNRDAYLLVVMCFHMCEPFSHMPSIRWTACLYVRHLNICVICGRWLCVSLGNLCVYMDEHGGYMYFYEFAMLERFPHRSHLLGGYSEASDVVLSSFITFHQLQ